MTAPTEHKSISVNVARAASLRRDGRLDEAVALLAEALVQARAQPLDVPFGDRVQLGLTMADLYLATGQREQAHSLLLAETHFAEQLSSLTRASGTPEQVRAASAGHYRLRDAATQLALVGQPAPEIGVVEWVLGRPTTLAEQRGNVVLIDFWASWCRPCLAAFPVLREWQNRYAKQGLTIVALTRYVLGPRSDPVAERARQRDAVCSTIAHRDLDFAVGIAPDGQLQQHYGATGVPACVLIDRAGIVRSASPMADTDELEQSIISRLNTSSSPCRPA